MGERSAAPKKSYVPDDVVFQTKPEIALDLVRRALAHGVRVQAWKFDELYGRSGPFLRSKKLRSKARVKPKVPLSS